jgi:hypothetical protein
VPARAQEGVRNSLAGQAAAEARKIQLQNQNYTFKSGDFRLLAEPSIEVQYNDNVNVSQNAPQDDVILKPIIHFLGTYPISDRNLFQFDVGVGYDQYVNHSSYSGFRLDTYSQLSYDIYVKDFWINLHDRMSYTRDPAGQSGVANTAFYGGFDNSVGLTTTWDLQDLVVTVGYDHENYISATSDFNQMDRASEVPVARVGLGWAPRFTAGLEGTASSTRYDEPVLNDNTGYSGGLYGDWQPGSYLHVLPRVGYTFYDFDQTSRYVQAVDQDTWYADLTVRHDITDTISYSLSAGHELRLGVQADTIEDWYVRPTVSFKIIKGLGLNTYISYEDGTQRITPIAPYPDLIPKTEDYDWFGAGFGVNYRLMRRLLVGLDYRFTIRSSSITDRDYTQDLVGLRLTYQPAAPAADAL